MHLPKTLAFLWVSISISIVYFIEKLCIAVKLEVAMNDVTKGLRNSVHHTQMRTGNALVWEAAVKMAASKQGEYETRHIA